MTEMDELGPVDFLVFELSSGSRTYPRSVVREVTRLSESEFIRVIQDAALDAGRRIKLIAFRFQPYDHSVLLPLYQSDYLKCALFYVY